MSPLLGSQCTLTMEDLTWLTDTLLVVTDGEEKQKPATTDFAKWQKTHFFRTILPPERNLCYRIAKYAQRQLNDVIRFGAVYDTEAKEPLIHDCKSESINQSNNQTRNECPNKPINQSIGQDHTRSWTTNQSINQSINQEKLFLCALVEMIVFWSDIIFRCITHQELPAEMFNLVDQSKVRELLKKYTDAVRPHTKFGRPFSQTDKDKRLSTPSLHSWTLAMEHPVKMPAKPITRETTIWNWHKKTHQNPPPPPNNHSFVSKKTAL